MRLTLSLLRCPDSVTPERRVVTGGEYSIGRGMDNDWVLPDPPRLLSKRHCVVVFRSGEWHVSDLSTNGTYINHETAPIGTHPRPLRSGDRLVLGAYEIEVGVENEARDNQYSWNRDSEPARTAFEATNRNHAGNPFADDPPSKSGLVGLPEDFDPFGDDFGGHSGEGHKRNNTPDHPFRPATQPDHTPATEDAFRPPSAVVPLPDDWALDWPETTPKPSQPAAPPPATTAPAGTPPSGDLLAAFLRGAGAEGTQIDDPVRTMETLGEVLRAMVVGVREALIARLNVKGEFRIEQTMIRASGNNPLKFSAGDDDALASLLGNGRRGGMKPAAAVAEALRDIQLHELATVTAMQEAVRALVAKLDPAALERQAGQAGFQASFGKLLNPVKVRAWDAYAALHTEISEALSDDFDSVFGKAFARAYEQALEEMTERDRRR